MSMDVWVVGKSPAGELKTQRCFLWRSHGPSRCAVRHGDFSGNHQMSFAFANKRTLLALACGLLTAGVGHAGVSTAQVDQGLTNLRQRATSTDRLIVSYRDASVADAKDA